MKRFRTFAYMAICIFFILSYWIRSLQLGNRNFTCIKIWQINLYNWNFPCKNRHKGSDASWVGDIELPPEIAAELSDDECRPEPQEHRKPQKRKHGSQERHKQFEEDMNRCNILNNHAVRLVEAHRHVPRISRYNDHVQRVLFNDVAAQGNRLPPSFDPTVPPPGFHTFPRYQTPLAMWSRHVPVTHSRPPRCNLFRQNQTYHSNTYTNNDANNGPGTSSHPY